MIRYGFTIRTRMGQRVENVSIIAGSQLDAELLAEVYIDLIGARQSGGFELRHARLPDDTDLLTRARELATTIIGADPALQRRDNQRLRERAVARYPRAVELFRVG